MAATAGIIHHAMTAGQTLKGTAIAPMAGSTAGASGTSGSSGSPGSSNAGDASATISANDFLTLLVTEMQNQDPTADTDPNEYIDQLVQVNSLEQLIQINQTLSTDLGSSATASTSGATTQATGQAAGTAANPASASSITAPQTASHATGAQSPVAFGAPAGSAPAAQTPASAPTAGNARTSRINAAAQRVAHALDGQTRPRPARGGSPATQ